MLVRKCFFNNNITLRGTYARNCSRWAGSLPIEDDVIIEVQKVQKTKSIKSNRANSDKVYIPEIRIKNLRTVINKQKPVSKYKKLEFLGDAYLDFVMSFILFSEFPQDRSNILAQKKEDYVTNKKLATLCHKSGIIQLLKYKPEDLSSKLYADIFEAYLGAIAFESGIPTSLNDFKARNAWNGWTETIKFIISIESSFKDYKMRKDISEFNHKRRVLQITNTKYFDLKKLSNIRADDFEGKIEVERLQFLGNSALKYFVSKIVVDRLNFEVYKLAYLRDEKLRKKTISTLTATYLKCPSFSLFYSIFKKKYYGRIGQDEKNKACSNDVKLFLGYMIATHFTYSLDLRCEKLFGLGWSSCESLINGFYLDDIMNQTRKMH